MENKELVPAEKKPDIPMENGIFMPTTFDQMWRIATIYANSGMVPKNYIENPQAVMVAGQFGAMLGLDLLPALQNIAVVNGMPAIWGDAQLAIVRNSGTLETFIELYEGTAFDDDFKAICIAKRTGIGSVYDPNMSLDDARRSGLFVNEFSVADAKTARLWEKDGPWDSGKVLEAGLTYGPSIITYADNHVQGKSFATSKKELLVKYGTEISLRYAVQLMAPAAERAKINERNKVTREDVEAVRERFASIEESIKHLKEWEEKFMK